MGELVYEYQNNLLPGIYDSYFQILVRVHHYHTRSRANQNLFIPRPRTNQYGKFNVRYAAADFWNKIPLNIKNGASLQKSLEKVEGERGWRSGESTRLPPMWPGFDSRTWRHMWVEFVVGSHPCSGRFFSG